MKGFRTTLILSCVIFLCTFSAEGVRAQSKKDLQKSKALIEQGDKAYRARNYRAAIDAYGQAAAIVPNNPHAHYWKAAAHYELKENAAAETEFETALIQGFKPIEVYRIRFFLFLDQKKYDLAILDLKKAAQIEPNNTLFLNGMGDTYFVMGRYAESLEAFQKALVIDPKNADAYYNISRVNAALGKVKEQRAAAEEAIKRGTKFVGESYYLIGDAAQRQRDLDAAISAYQRAIAAKPDRVQSYLNLADIYSGQYRINDAIDIAKRALLRSPGNADILTNLSWYYSFADRPVDAVTVGRQAVAARADNYLAYTNLCRAYNDLKEYAEAIKSCNTALKLKPNDGETQFYLATALSKTGRKSEAVPLYSKAVKGLVEFVGQNPSYPDGYYLLGNAYVGDAQYDKAIDAFLKCLELSPRYAKARYNLAQVYSFFKKNRQAAMEQYNELLKLDPALAEKLKAIMQ